MSTEIRWTKGKSQYNREEIEYMLDAQRAMIYNDVNTTIYEICECRSEIGKMNNDELTIMHTIRNCRKVKI